MQREARRIAASVIRIDAAAPAGLGGGMDDDAHGPLWKKWAWFVGLWAGGVLVVGSLGYALRWWLHP